MLSMIVLATTMWVCPGDVFSDVDKPGCKPFVEHQGTVNVEPTMPKDREIDTSSSSDSSARPEKRRRQQDSSVNEELCALYKEYIAMEIRTQGGFQTSGPDETQRWQTLKRMFQGQRTPDCS